MPELSAGPEGSRDKGDTEEGQALCWASPHAGFCRGELSHGHSLLPTPPSPKAGQLSLRLRSCRLEMGVGTALSSSSPGCHRSWSLWVPQLSQLMARERQLSLGTAPSGQCPTSTSTASRSFISSNELGAARGPASQAGII